MSVSLDDITNFLALGTSVPDATLQFYLSDAKVRVTDDGVASTNTKYDLLVRLATGMLMVKQPAAFTNSGVNSGGAGGIKKEKVFDVELEYSESSGIGSEVLSKLAGGGYEHEYLRVLRTQLDMTHIYA